MSRTPTVDAVRTAPRARFRWHRNHHRDAALVLRILRVRLDEVALFELDRHEDVGRGHHGEQQVRHRHRRRGPEREEPAQIQRVTNQSIRARGDEVQRRVLAATEVQPDLAKSEQVEVVDQQGGDEHQQEPEAEKAVEHRARG